MPTPAAVAGQTDLLVSPEDGTSRYGSEFNPRIASVPGGGFLVVWRDVLPETDAQAPAGYPYAIDADGGFTLMFRILDAAGLPAGPATPVSTDFSGSMNGVGIATLADGKVLIAFDAAGNPATGSGRIAAVVIDPATGLPAGPEVTIFGTAGAASDRPEHFNTLALPDGSGAVLHLRRDSNPDRLEIATIGADGTLGASNPVQLPAGVSYGSIGSMDDRAVALRGAHSGDIALLTERYVGFTAVAGVFFMNADGSAALPAIELPQSFGAPMLAAMPDGGIVVGGVVPGPAGSTMVRILRIDATGAATPGWPVDVTFAGNDFGGLDLLALPDGGLMVGTSVLVGGSDSELLGQRIAADGTLDGGTFALNTPTPRFQSRPHLALVEDGSAMVLAWEDDRTLANPEIRAARFDLGLAAPPQTGGEGADTLTGDSRRDLIEGRGGDDVLRGGAGRDTILGGAGFDAIFGEDGDDRLLGGDGDDHIQGGAGNDVLLSGNGGGQLLGGDGDDTLNGGTGDFGQVLMGEAGQDILIGGGGNDSLDGGEGNDRVLGGTGDDQAGGGAGHDTLLGGSGADTLYGNADADRLVGEAGEDALYGEDGNDVLLGGDGNDALLGGAGDDTLNGGEGENFLNGNAGDDLLVARGGTGMLLGEDGNDTLNGGPEEAAQVLLGGEGDDLIVAGGGDDSIGGAGGTDRIFGGTGDDFAWGEDGTDTLRGGEGADTLMGGADNDRLMGEAGNDLLDGESGADRLLGGEGADTLHGGLGADALFGDAGADIFVFFIAGDAGDTIFGFEQGVDRISVSGIQALDPVDFLGTGSFTGTTGEVRFTIVGNRTLVELDGLDADAVADLSFMLNTAITLTAADFIL